MSRLSLKQTRITVSVALLLGLLISFIQIGHDLATEQKQADAEVHQVLETVREAAVESAYAVSKPLATRVVNGLFNYRPIIRAEITDDFGETLALRQRESQTGALSGVAEFFFGSTQKYDLPLYAAASNLEVGALRVELDSYIVALTFFERSALIILSDIVHSLTLAFILVFIFNYTLTRPLVAATNELKKNDPKLPQINQLSVPHAHQDTEFGELLAAINELLVATGSHIEEREKAEQALARHLERLEYLVAERTQALEAAKENELRNEKLAAVGQVTATVSHELRNPLGTIQSSLYTIKRELGENVSEKAQRGLERVERNIARCVNIIEHLLDYSRKIQLHKEVVDVNSWLKETIAEFEIPEGIKIEFKTDVSVELALDKERLRQVLQNVLQNSWQGILGTQIGKGVISISARRQDNRYEICIADNGPGIKTELLEKVFEPLFSTKNFGIGLGLPLVKQILRQHGGEVEIESSQASGTLVRLMLPIMTQSARGLARTGTA